MKKVEGIMFREGRTLAKGEKVEVYYNLLKGGFSIVSKDKRNPDRNRVVAYAENVTIVDATFHISERILAQIREKKCKNVYAVVRGTFVDIGENLNPKLRRGYCNPYTTGKFIDWETKEELLTAKEVYFYERFFSYLPI